MISEFPEEAKAKSSILPSLIGNESRRATIDTVLHNAATARRGSASIKRHSLQSAIRRNPWKEEETVNDESSLPGQLKQLGRGLNRKRKTLEAGDSLYVALNNYLPQSCSQLSDSIL